MVFKKKKEKVKTPVVKIKEEEKILKPKESTLREEIPYLELGSKVNGKFYKSESYTLEQFADKMVNTIGDDIIQALKAYGKDVKLKDQLKQSIKELIALDKPGVKIN